MRDKRIDFFKGYLVIFMILAHCNQFFGAYSHISQEIVTEIINLTTFSGFFFAFGYVFHKAYLSRERSDVTRKILSNSFKTYLAFCISGVAFELLIVRVPFDLTVFFDVFLLRKFPGWSEFLISFSAVTLIGLVAFNYLKSLNHRRFFIISVISVLACCIPYQVVTSPILAIFIGSTHYITFPVLQYFIFFVAGIYFAKYQIHYDKKIMVVSLVTFISLMIYLVIEGRLPDRFPPSIQWICSSIFYLYLLYLISIKVSAFKGVEFVCRIGENTLIYLLLSNLFIFSFADVIGRQYELGACVLITMLILSVIGYLIQLTHKRASQ